MFPAKSVNTTIGVVTRTVSSRRSLFGGAAAVVLGIGITAGVAASAADLVPSDTADTVLLAICARAEEADRLLRDADSRHRELTGKLARAVRDQSDMHFDAFVSLADQAAAIPALTMAGMRAKARIVYLNADMHRKANDLQALMLRDLGWGA